MSDHKTALEIKKLEAEIAKLASDSRKTELEVLELRRWWRRPPVLQSYAAISVAVVTAFLGWANGWFSAKLEKIENQQFRAQQALDNVKQEEVKAKAILQAERDVYIRDTNKAIGEREIARAQLAELSAKLGMVLKERNLKASEAAKYSLALRQILSQTQKGVPVVSATESRSTPLTEDLRLEYEHLFSTMVINIADSVEGQHVVNRITSNRKRYAAVQELTNVPWQVVAALHQAVISLRFDRHLHNGDSLADRTINVPAGRPIIGNPPFTWEESAVDALALERMSNWPDWSIAGTLYRLESYNGFGYRRYHEEVKSPFLWAGSNYYTKGSYGADGKWEADAVKHQLGAAVVLKALGYTGFGDVPKSGN